MLRPYGEVHVTHKTKQPFIKWNLEELAFKCHLVVGEVTRFNKEDYPLYNHKRGDGANSDQPFPMGECFTYKFRLCLSAKKERSCIVSTDTFLPASAPHVEHDHIGLAKFLEISQIPTTSIPQENIGYGTGIPISGVQSYGNYEVAVSGRRWLVGNHVSTVCEVPGRRYLDGNYVCCEVPERRWSGGNCVSEVPERRWSGGNYVSEVPERRWSGGNYVSEVPERRWRGGIYVSEVRERRWLDGNYVGDVQERGWLDGNYVGEVRERRLLRLYGLP